jgi:O-acetyl-ADP-ribose deacetylase
LTAEHNIKTIAFPCISTGAYRFPFEKAAVIALENIIAFLKESEKIQKVFLVVFDNNDLVKYERVFKNYEK